jgi:hypothetical protein
MMLSKNLMKSMIIKEKLRSGPREGSFLPSIIK